ncbi:hypothetical protein [Cryptosporangium sp. NPDC048952]
MAPGHYGFLVDDGTFDALLTRLDGIPDGHTYEFFTAVPRTP